MRQQEIIDEYSYLLELEKPITRIIRTTPKPKKEETKIEEKKEFSKPILIGPIYRYNKDGDLVDDFLNSKQLAKQLGWRESRVNDAADKETLYKGFLLTRIRYTKKLILERFKDKIKVPRQKKPKVVKQPRQKKEKVVKIKKPYIQFHLIYQYNKDGELVASYDNSGDMAKKTKLNHNTVKNYSKKETVYNGFLITHTYYDPQQAKERFVEALNRQQMTYIYKGGELVATFSTLTQVKEYIKSTETLKRISYYKEKHKPIEGYILSAKPL